MSIIYLILVIAWIVGMWKMFEKAGRAGWTALIPFYNLWVLNEIGGKPWWWFICYFIPIINIICYFLLSVSIAEKFGQTFIYGVAIFFLPFIFYPILGFGGAKYSR